MTPQDKALETVILQQLAVEYWYLVDHKSGDGASDMFTPDGIFHVGPGDPLVGRKAINEFYRWRENRGERTSRHLLNNFRAEFADANNATTICVMQLLADDGAPVHPSAPPIFIGDQIDNWRKGDDGVWRLTKRDFSALFMGGVAPTTPPASIAETHNNNAENKG